MNSGMCLKNVCLNIYIYIYIYICIYIKYSSFTFTMLPLLAKTVPRTLRMSMGMQVSIYICICICIYIYIYIHAIYVYVYINIILQYFIYIYIYTIQDSHLPSSTALRKPCLGSYIGTPSLRDYVELFCPDENFGSYHACRGRGSAQEFCLQMSQTNSRSETAGIIRSECHKFPQSESN